LPFLFALAVIIFLGWSVSLAWIYPYDGIPNYEPTGLIIEIDALGPNSEALQEGDIILSVDRVPMVEARPLYGNKRPGDIANLIIQRGGTDFSVPITLVVPSFEERISRLGPLIVALIFWGIGVGIQAFKPAREASNLFFLFFIATALLLIAGVSSYLGPPWTSSLVNILLWFIGPLVVHFHFYFPQNTPVKGRRYLLIGLYTIAVIGSLPYLIWGTLAVQSSPWFPQYQLANRIFLAVNFTLAVGLLFYSYQNATTAGVRGKIRIVVLGGVLSLLPLVFLVVIPDALLQVPIIPYAYALLWLALLPLTYGYAIFRHRLIEIERHVNRGATFILVYSILAAIYLILYVLINRVLPPELTNAAVVNTVLVLVLASVFVPLRQRIQRIVDSVFYGGWYDYRFAISQITQGLEQIPELRELAETISQRLVATLRLEETTVFLADLAGDFSVIAVAPKPVEPGRKNPSYAPLPRTSLSYLLNMGEAVERSALRSALSEVELSPEEHQLLNSEQVHLWVPVIGHGSILGLLALGPKMGGDIFSGEDIDILRVVARQISPLIENIHLVTRLKRYAAELEQRVAERTDELYASKERVEAILASVADGVVVTDLDGTLITVNAAYEEQSGFQEAELIGQKLWDFYADEDLPDRLEEMRGILQEGKVWIGELVGVRNDGSQNDVQMTVAPLRDEQNQIVGYVGSQRDITHQKELDRLKDLFVSDVSHELRTPTTNISLYLELLDGATPKKRKAYLEVLKDQSYLLMKLVEDILDLSRLSIGKAKKIEFAPIDINVLTEQIVTAHRPMAEAAGLMLVFEPDMDIPPVWGEQNQLARVINNLLSNAIRYTTVGGVYVSTQQTIDQICLEVTDTGMGIHPEDQAHLFERFYRGKRVRQTKIHGTGLGLAIVKEIIDLHDGNIEVISEVDKGSTFSVYFPLQVGELWPEKLS